MYDFPIGCGAQKYRFDAADSDDPLDCDGADAMHEDSVTSGTRASRLSFDERSDAVMANAVRGSKAGGTVDVVASQDTAELRARYGRISIPCVERRCAKLRATKSGMQVDCSLGAENVTVALR